MPYLDQPLLPPDRSGDYSWSSGGTSVLADIPEPRVYWYRDDRRRRRPVCFKIVRWQMYSHYWVIIDEDDDRVWDGRVDPLYQKKGSWRILKDDSDGRGERISKECNTVEVAEDFLIETLMEKFPRKTHKWLYETDDKCPKWLLEREKKEIMDDSRNV